MEGWLKISLIFLGIILFVGGVSAYTSFSLVKEDKDSKKAIIIDYVESLRVADDYETVIELLDKNNDFADLIWYLRSSKITRVVYYKDDIHPDIIELLEKESGVSFRRLLEDIDIDYGWQEEESNQPKPIFVGSAINQQESLVNVSFFVVSSIVIVVILAILLVLITKKKKRK